MILIAHVSSNAKSPATEAKPITLVEAFCAAFSVATAIQQHLQPTRFFGDAFDNRGRYRRWTIWLTKPQASTLQPVL
jgi:hypothetical protein